MTKQKIGKQLLKEKVFDALYINVLNLDYFDYDEGRKVTFNCIYKYRLKALKDLMKQNFLRKSSKP